MANEKAVKCHDNSSQSNRPIKRVSNNRLTTGAESYTGKLFERFEPQTHAAGYYGSPILIGLFAQTMDISNTAILGEINCPNTRLRVKLEPRIWKLKTC